MALSGFPYAYAAPISNSATGSLNGVPLDLSNATANLNSVSGGGPAVTSILAEISPNAVGVNSIGETFTYDLLPTIGPGNTGFDQIAITAPVGYTNFSVSTLSISGTAQPASAACPTPGAGEYCTTIAGQVITLTLGSPVNTDQSPVRITFTGNTPGAAGTANWASLVDDTSTPPEAPQAAAAGNADGNAGDANSLAVEVKAIDATQSLVTASPEQVEIDIDSDGNPFSTITITPKDAAGVNLGPGLTVSVSVVETAPPLEKLAAIKQAPGDPFGSFTPMMDNGDGTYTTQLSSTISGIATITATVNALALGSKPQVIFTAGQVLKIIKTANKTEGVIGDVITYEVEIQNTVGRSINNVTLNDRIPPGFKYLKGSTLINDSPASDPGGSQTLRFTLNTIDPWVDQNGDGLPGTGDLGNRRVSYQLVIGSSATPGDYENTAQAVDFAPISNQSTAKVTVTFDPIFDLGTLIGKVFFDTNKNGYQDPGESGIGGAMIALDDGTYVITDANGLYHFPGVRPGERLLKINRTTLPAGTTITTEEARIIQVSRGLLSKVNYGVVFDIETEHIGAPGTRGLTLKPETEHETTQITGHLESMQLLVNGKAVNLHLNEVRLGVEDFQESVEIYGEQLTKAIQFSIHLDTPETVKSWRLTIMNADGQTFKQLEGEGPPPEPIVWDGKNNKGQLIRGGEVYAYQLQITSKDLGVETSEQRLFGVNKTSAISLNLMGSAFATGSSELSLKTIEALHRLSEVLKKHPSEKITIEGHTDNIGSKASNDLLSKTRAEAAMHYLISKEGIHKDRFILKWFGASRPVASNQHEEGREVNRRVEIKGALTDIKKAKILSHLRTSPSVRINGVPMDLKNQDRFALKLKHDINQFKFEMANAQGKLIETTLKLPNLSLIAPIEQEVLKMHHANRRYHFLPVPKDASKNKNLPLVLYRLQGTTDPNNTVYIDGKNIDVSKKGLIQYDLPLKNGENLFTLVVTNPQQISRMMTLHVDLSDKDDQGRLLMAVRPVPQISVLLPPKGAVSSHTQLPIRGMTPRGNRVLINGKEIPVDEDGTFSNTANLKKGHNTLVIEVVDPEGYTGRIEREIEVSDSSLFLMAFADSEFGQITNSGNLQAAGVEKVQSYYSKGRLAYYLKGTIQGKYLITSAFDTGKQDFKQMFNNLDQQETDRFFTNIDPDKFYPVYGDDSTVVYDAQSQGKLYLAIDSDDIHFLVGNYTTHLNDTELANFNRTLYGGRFEYRSVSKTEYGDPHTQIVLFGANVQQAHIQNTFRATGGSLYYLSEKNIIEGSEQVRLEIRDQQTGLVLAKIDQVRDADYSFKYEEGRILFRRPISSVVSNDLLFRQERLQGHPVFVLVDFEYTAQNFEKKATGGRLQQQIGDHLAVGGTYIEDASLTGDYSLKGADAQIRLGQGTTLRGEYAESVGENASTLISEDGGLSFTPIASASTGDGTAYHLSVRSDLSEWFGGKDRMVSKAYYHRLSPNFFSNGTLLEQGLLKYGGELEMAISPRDTLRVSYNLQEIIASTNIAAANQAGADRIDLKAVEYDHHRGPFLFTGGFQEKTLHQTTGLLEIEKQVSSRMMYQINDRFTTSLGHQQLIQGNEGYRTTLGLKVRITDSLDSIGEVAHANDSDAALFGLSARLDNRSNLYLNEKLDKKEGEEATFGTILGGDRMLTSGLRLYGEYGEDRGQLNQSRSLWGLDQRFGEKRPIKVFLNYERSHLKGLQGNTTRDSASLTLKYDHPAGSRLAHRFEVRLEKGNKEIIQRLTTHYGELKILSGLTLFGKFNFSDTTNKSLDRLEARFAELGSGVAYRPVYFDTLNLIAKYTILIDQHPGPTGPMLKTDARVASIEAIIDLSKYLQLAEKYAVKNKEEEQALRANIKSRTHLWINRLNIHVSKRWDLSGEYRILQQSLANDQLEGYLLEVNRAITDHMRFGIGYNFSQFTDNEFSDNNFDARGWFIRVQGKY